mgnify:CR=1 FL=1
MAFPVTILGGYLGSGKTTLVNHMLRNNTNKRIAILVNEFGDLPIDEDLIESRDDNLISLAGGCICCSYGDALIEGINNCNSKFFCIFNADGSFNPIEIDLMEKFMIKDKLDLIFASRYEKNSSSDDDTIITLIGNYIFTLLGKIFFKLTITDILYTFVLGNTENTKHLNLKEKDFCFCVELPIKARRKNLKIASLNSHERKRIAGKKKVNALRDGWIILMEYFNLIKFRKK